MSGPHRQAMNVRQIQIVAVCTLCLVLSTAAIILRLLARRISTVKYWWDDGTAILALVSTTSLQTWRSFSQSAGTLLDSKRWHARM